MDLIYCQILNGATNLHIIFYISIYMYMYCMIMDSFKPAVYSYIFIDYKMLLIFLGKGVYQTIECV